MAGFDFSAGTLPSGATLTRSTTGTRVDETGTIRAEAIDAPRFDYDPLTHALRGLLIEPARTNLALQSGAFDLTPWTYLGDASVTANNTAHPSGVTGADTLNETGSGSAYHIWYQTQSFASAGSVVVQVFLKQLGRRYCAVCINSGTDSTSWAVAIIDLQTGVITKSQSSGSATLVSATVQEFPGSFFRVVLVVSTTAVLDQVKVQSAASGTPSIGSYGDTSFIPGINAAAYIAWAMDVQAGSQAYSHVPTEASAVTCAADVLSLNWGAQGITDGAKRARYTFDDGSWQDLLMTVASGFTTVPTNLTRRRIKRIDLVFATLGLTTPAGRAVTLADRAGRAIVI